jgi:hypothetical protein
MATTDPADQPNPETPSRFRCGNCGNLTRFDVYETRRIRAFYHFTLGGDLSIDEEEVLETDRERVACRWCGSSDSIEELSVEPGQPPAEEPDRQP